MLRKIFVLLLIGLFLCTLTLTQSQAKELKPKWRFELGGTNFGMSTQKQILGVPQSFQVAYLGEFTAFLGDIGIGTVLWERNNFTISKQGEAEISARTYDYRLDGIGLHSIFPIVIYWVPYSRKENFGNMGFHGYLKGSLWTVKYFSEYATYFQWFSYGCCASPSAYMDVGISYFVNPWKFLLINLRLGMLRMNYEFPHREPYKGRIPSSMTSTSFYLLMGISLGLWDIAH
jgi:hypothetical protein